jgi:hypothetical protein
MKELLIYQKVMMEKINVKRRSINVYECTIGFLEPFTFLHGKKNNVFKVTFSNHFPNALIIDDNLFFVVLSILLKNSVQNNRNGNIDLDIRYNPADHNLRVTLKDNSVITASDSHLRDLARVRRTLLCDHEYEQHRCVMFDPVNYSKGIFLANTLLRTQGSEGILLDIDKKVGTVFEFNLHAEVAEVTEQPLQQMEAKKVSSGRVKLQPITFFMNSLPSTRHTRNPAGVQQQNNNVPHNQGEPSPNTRTPSVKESQ